MSATGAPSKALKVRPPAAKHYKLRHSCPLPNSLGDRLTGARCTVTRHGHIVSIVNTQNTTICSIRRMEINPEYRHQTVSQSRVNDAVNGEKIPRIGRVCIQPWHQTFRKTNRWTDADWRSVPAGDGDLDTDMRFSNNRNFCQKLVFAVRSLAVKHRTRGT